jgi:hypothetical protein
MTDVDMHQILTIFLWLMMAYNELLKSSYDHLRGDVVIH